MAYNCTSVCTRVQHFSNPNVYNNGDPTGDADWFDNARSLNNAATTVANWRQSMATSLPYAPSDLWADAVSYRRIDLSWSDNADNESGYRIERADTSGNFTEVAVTRVNVNGTYLTKSQREWLIQCQSR